MSSVGSVSGTESVGTSGGSTQGPSPADFQAGAGQGYSNIGAEAAKSGAVQASAAPVEEPNAIL